MPRGRQVKTTYGKAGTSPSDRIHPEFLQQLTNTPKGLSPLAQYLLDNEDTGIPLQELVRQFQEYDCEHKTRSVVAKSAHKETTVCKDCGLVETKVRYA